MTEETPLTYFNAQAFCITSDQPGLIPFLCGGPVAEGTRLQQEILHVSVKTEQLVSF